METIEQQQSIEDADSPPFPQGKGVGGLGPLPGDGPQPPPDASLELAGSPHAVAVTELEIGPLVDEVHPAPLLESSLALPRPTPEALAWLGVIAAALIARLASLTNSPFSAAEAQRAYAAWQFADGQRAVVDGALWGPLPLVIDALLFFLFGARDIIARLGPALAGVALVPLCWLLRPYLGRWGALGVAAMLALSPTFVYGARQVSGVPWAALAAFALFLCILRLAERPATTGLLMVAGIAVAFLIGSGPAGLTTLHALGLALMTLLAFDRPRDDAEGDSPLRRIGANLRAIDRRVWWGVVAVAGVLLIAACSLFFTDIGHLPGTIGSLVGGWWGDLFATQRNEPWFYYLLVMFTYEPFIGTAAIIGVVLTARTLAPRPLTMTLPFVWQLAALVLFSLSGGKTPEATMLLLLPLALTGGLAVQWLGERLAGGWFWRDNGWVLSLSGFLTALAVVQFIRQLADVERNAAWIATVLALIAVILAAGYVSSLVIAARGGFEARTTLLTTLLVLAAVIGVRAMSDVTFARPADGRELLVGTRTAASMTPFVERIRRISVDLTRNERTLDPATSDRSNIGGGNTMAIVVDPALEWPLHWYFREFPNFAVDTAQGAAATKPTTTNGASGASLPRIVIVPSAQESQATTALPGYVSQQYPATVSFPATYRTLGTVGFFRDLFSAASWVNRVRYFVAHEPPVPPTTDAMSVFASKEVADRAYFAGAASASQAPPSNLFDRAGKGKAGGQFSAPRGIAVGPDGTINIVDQLNYRVQQFSPDGAFIRQWGGIGTGPDKFGQINGYAFGPTGLAITPDGTIFVADTWNHRIAAFAPDGRPLRQWGTFFNGQETPATLPQHNGDFYGPRGIAIGPTGLLYVTDTGNSRVQVFDQTGKFVRAFGSLGTAPGQMDNPVGIAARKDGTIAVADTNNARVLLFSAEGQFQSAIPVPDWATVRGLEAYIGFLPNGNLLVPSPTGNRLTELTTQGQTVRSISGAAGDLRKPVAFALAPDGTTAYVINDETNTVVKVSLA